MREPFNTTCDVYAGPGTATPLALRGTFACRLVFEDAIATLGTNAPDIPYYLTMQGIVPIGYWGDYWATDDWSKADLIAVPSGDPIKYRVIYTDEINWMGQATYYRAYLVEAVETTAIPCGGVVGSGRAGVSSASANAVTVVGEGGAVVGGAAAWRVGYMRHGCGVGVLGGSATIAVPRVLFTIACGTSGYASGTAEVVFTPAPPPTVYWEDSFTDTDGTDLDSHTPEVGTFYTTAFGSMQTYNDSATMLSPSSDFSTVTFDPGVTQGTITYVFKVQPQSEESGQRTHYFKIRSNGVDDYFSIIFNWDPSTDTSDNWVIEKTAGGTPSTVATSTGTLAADTEYSVEIVDDGASISVTVDSETIFTTDSDFNTNTNMVMQFFSAGPTNAKPYLDSLLFVP